MPKQKTHQLVMKKKPSKGFILHINPSEIKVRKPQPPTTKRHKTKTDYARKLKHPTQTEE